MKSSTILILRLKSISEAGPFHRISTPRSLPAATAPACTLCQKMWACPFGTTAMTRLCVRLQEPAQIRLSSPASTIQRLEIGMVTSLACPHRAGIVPRQILLKNAETQETGQEACPTGVQYPEGDS